MVFGAVSDGLRSSPVSVRVPSCFLAVRLLFSSYLTVMKKTERLVVVFRLFESHEWLWYSACFPVEREKSPLSVLEDPSVTCGEEERCRLKEDSGVGVLLAGPPGDGGKESSICSRESKDLKPKTGLYFGWGMSSQRSPLEAYCRRLHHVSLFSEALDFPS